ncbi:hypothetical protein LMH87_002301 [Akanthomyces muscarius]|uniref:Uncharacterized protein n=1 Tax=Akanthomyces muscarius TaxID=2231603 RepID=A0A9W8Q608_AKAMU|nr:hypothetical protein LMH87_002301 [Akanthomyces muscarius]KAJ4147797.1 hypothetical protein LMH87_002301 [Akanthomyces muscarius]
MQVQQPSEQHCFDQHCGLCTFELGDDEPIIATNVLGTRFARLTKPRSEYCDWNCNHPHNIAAAFHESCLAYAGPFFLPIEELGRMIRHSLIPELGASLANPALMEEFAARYVMEHTPFPLEVCQRIAPYLVRPCSVAATLSVRGGKPRKTTVSLLGEIWVQFVKVHGAPYVAFVANTPAPASYFAGTAVLVYRPWQHDCVVRIMHDPWGVRRIVFMRENSKLSVSERKNIWWENLRLPTTSESQELTIFSDEVKLRRMWRDNFMLLAAGSGGHTLVHAAPSRGMGQGRLGPGYKRSNINNTGTESFF